MRAAIFGGLAASRNRGKSDNINNTTTVNNSDSTANATPTRPRPSRTTLRPPLGPKDSNADMRVPPKAPLAGKGPNSNMLASSDKKGPPTRTPLAPTLSAAAKAAQNKTPVAPRLTGASPSVSTPVSQRKARPESITPASSTRKDLSTPVSSFLGHNITPRSGLRKTRTDSPNAPPSGTPRTPAAASPGPRLAKNVQRPGSRAGLGIQGLDRDTPTRKMSSFSPSVSEVGYSRSPIASSPADSKFFFANEAKSSTPTPHPIRPPLRTKTSNSSFCYANGEPSPDLPHSSGSAAGSIVGGDRSHHRIYNGMAGMHSSSASAVGSMVGGERTHHRPFHVQSESYSHNRSPSALGSMIEGDKGHPSPRLFHGEFRPHRAPSAVGSRTGSMVGSMLGSERSHSQFFHADGTPDEIPDSPCGSAVGSLVGSMYGDSRPKFFHASDVIPHSSGVPHSSGASAVGSIAEEEEFHPKFFHANGTPDMPPSPSVHFAPPRRPSSVVSSSSRVTSPRIVAAPHTSTATPSPRPPSPSKLRQAASTSSISNNGKKTSSPTVPSPGAARPQTGRGQSASSVVHTRRASIEVAHRVVNHARSISFDSKPETRTLPTRKYSGAGSSIFDNPTSPLSALMTHTLPVSTPEEISDGVEMVNGGNEAKTQGGPIKTGQTMEKLNELAANARRERKVLDLEITNSSLEAINRTLEREMRKQTAELRRYRRLSRSGRLSIGPSMSTRSSMGLNSVMEGGDELDFTEDEDEVDDGEESDFSDEEETSEEGSLSPRAVAESDARHRSRDEKRLRLDLSKHQQLLIDSQKMNQSLKRCLGWTEELINEGKKALLYQVRVSDVVIGGRILARDEVEGVDEGEGDNEGMSEVGAQMLRDARKAAMKEGATTWDNGKGKDDRDSGVDLDGPGSASSVKEGE